MLPRYLSEVQQHSCGWISDNRQSRVKRRWTTVEQRVNVNLPLGHPDENSNTHTHKNHIFKHMLILTQ